LRRPPRHPAAARGVARLNRYLAAMPLPAGDRRGL
jgi:hypothetical protein